MVVKFSWSQDILWLEASMAVNLVNKANLMHNLFLVYLSISTCFGRLCAHHQEKQLCSCDTWYCLVCRVESTLHTRQYQVLHEHRCFFWWWACSHPKHVEIDKHTKNKLCTKLALFTRLYRDAQSTKHKIWQWMFLLRSSGSWHHINVSVNTWPRGSCYLHLHPSSTYRITCGQKPELWHDRKTVWVVGQLLISQKWLYSLELVHLQYWPQCTVQTLKTPHADGLGVLYGCEHIYSAVNFKPLHPGQ